MRKLFLFIGLALFVLTVPSSAQAETVIAQDSSSAVILVYNRIGEDEYPETNIRLEQFAAHVRELSSGGYHVLPLPEIVKALKEEGTLPDKTIGITFDGAHRSVLEDAAPLLLKSDLPFTVFASTDNADRPTAQYMDWNDLRKLAREKGVTIGLHPASYTRLTTEPESEMARQLNNARTRFREEMKQEPAFFAYPFGEYNESYYDIITAHDFDAAFGQQSAVAWGGADIFALPRFPITDAYGGLDRFRMIASALPLPVTDIHPQTPSVDKTRPAIGFTIDKALQNQTASLSCFVSGQGQPTIESMGAQRIEIRLERPLEQERTRINCTLPGPSDENAEDDERRWRWFGMLLTIPQSRTEISAIRPSAGIE